MKKILALVLAMMLVIGMTSAMAATLTIKKGSANIVDGHVFDAYEVLTGDLAADGKTLSNLAWGAGITPATLIAKVTANDSPIKDKFSGITATSTPTQFADKLAGLTTAEEIDAFRDMVAASLTSTKAATASTSPISLAKDGYYFVKDVTTLSTTEPDALSAYILQVVGNKEIDIKADAPDVDKDIVIDANTTDKENTANIGDLVEYKITSKVPNYDKYVEYYMDFEDTLSKGLTYQADTFSIKIDGKELTAENLTANPAVPGDYKLTVTANADGSTGIKIHLKDLVSRNVAKGKDIVISYKAMVNDDAVIGNAGNPNTVKLKYSNNPSDSGDGTPDNGNDGVQGTTPDHTVTTFVVGIRFLKVDKTNTSTTLEGAVFTVNATSINKVLLTGEHFVEDNTTPGTWFKLKNGNADAGYTEKEPNEYTYSKYADVNWNSGNKTYTCDHMYKKEAYATSSTQETANTTFEVRTKADGIIELTGLKEGTYTFTEIQAPDGYNLLEKPIIVTITSNIDGLTDPTKFAWSATKKEGTDGTASNLTLTKIGDSEVYEFTFNVLNGSGNTLPSTGGIGTTIFYVAGSILVLAAAILLITKRRMGADE